MDVNIYRPNPALAATLRGDHIRAILHEIGDGVALPLYHSIVHKRTGRLDASAEFHTEIGGIDHDRWVGVMSVGGGPLVDYELPHEFGHGNHLRSVHNLDGGNNIEQAAHDLNRVLEELGSL